MRRLEICLFLLLEQFRFPLYVFILPVVSIWQERVCYIVIPSPWNYNKTLHNDEL